MSSTWSISLKACPGGLNGSGAQFKEIVELVLELQMKQVPIHILHLKHSQEIKIRQVKVSCMFPLPKGYLALLHDHLL